MEGSPTQKFNPELVFRHIVFGCERTKTFSREDVASDWQKMTCEEPLQYVFDSLEHLVDEGRLIKTESGLYQQTPF